MVFQPRLTELTTRYIGLMFIGLGTQDDSTGNDIQHIPGLSHRAGAWIEAVVAQR